MNKFITFLLFVLLSPIANADLSSALKHQKPLNPKYLKHDLIMPYGGPDITNNSKVTAPKLLA